MKTISEYKFQRLIVSDKIKADIWEIWFDAGPAGYVEKVGKKYKALDLRKNLITETEKLVDAKQFVAMNRANRMGIEIDWKL